MTSALVLVVLTQFLPPGFTSKQAGKRLSTINQGTIDRQPPLLCAVTDSTLKIYQGASTSAATDLACTSCVSDSEIVGVSGSKVSGAVSSASALAANPSDCTSGQYATGIDSSGNLTCATPTSGSTPDVTCATDEALTWNGSVWSCVSKVRAAWVADAGVTAQTATALASDPADCDVGKYATAINASGTLGCSQVAYSEVSGTPTVPTVQMARTTGTHTIQSATATEVTALQVTLAGAGTYDVRYQLRVKSNDVNTSFKYGVNVTSNLSSLVCIATYPTTGGTAANGVGDGVTSSGVFALYEVLGATNSASTTTANMGYGAGVASNSEIIPVLIQCSIVTSGSGDLELWMGSESSSFSVTTQPNSYVIVTTIP